MSRLALKPAIFWDRDETLIHDKGYTYKVPDLKWKEGAIEAIKYFSCLGYRNFVVTNQSGVARGYYTVADVKKFHDAMQGQLALAGAYIDAYFFCPHHPEGTVKEFSFKCGCRKPGVGLVEKILKQYPTIVHDSVVVGDKNTDISVGKKMGMRTHKVIQSVSIFTQLKQSGLAT